LRRFLKEYKVKQGDVYDVSAEFRERIEKDFVVVQG